VALIRSGDRSQSSSAADGERERRKRASKRTYSVASENADSTRSEASLVKCRKAEALALMRLLHHHHWGLHFRSVLHHRVLRIFI
jgi:hypothetical protein